MMETATMRKDTKQDNAKSGSRQNRPTLSIITTPKGTWKKIFSRTPSSESSRSSSSSTNQYNSSFTFTSLPKTPKTPDQPLPKKANHNVHDKTYSFDTLSIKGVHHVQSILKRFQSHISISNNYNDSKSPEPHSLLTVPPDPIISSIIDWSPDISIAPSPWEESEAKSLDSKSAKHLSLSDSISFLSEFDTDSFDETRSDSSSWSTFIETPTSYQEPRPRIRRQSSLPNIHKFSMRANSISTKSSHTLTEYNDIITITEEHTKNVSLLKKNKSNSPNRKSMFMPCQKAREKAAEAAAQGESFRINSNSVFSSLCEDHLRHIFIPNVFDPINHEPVVKFAEIKPRKYQLHRRTCWKREAKALLKWHHSLETQLKEPFDINCLPNDLPIDKMERDLCTRRFILKEFFNTEISFWNQLYYTKLMFYDALEYSLKINAKKFVNVKDSDMFANLFDLMQFSAKLINRLRRFQVDYVNGFILSSEKEECNIECNNMYLGKILVEMAEDFVVFLRCAIDYRANRKKMDIKERNMYYIQERKKHFSTKESREFTMKDYLIIPIQRVVRYQLLVADVIRHTPSNHPDYKNLVRAYHIISSLANAMNSAQKKG